MEIEVKRWEAAMQQLLKAVACYEGADFIAAITLASAAEELFDKELAVRRPGLQRAREADKNVLEFLHSGAVSESVKGQRDQPIRKLAADTLGAVQNFLKHGSIDALRFDAEFEAADRLQRCVDMIFWMTGDPSLRDDWNRRIRFLHKPRT